MSICFSRTASPQRGIALIVLLALIGFMMVGVLLSIAHSSAMETQRQKRTAESLAKAKDGLVAYAVAVLPDTYAKRPGDLPCPDSNNDGQAETTCPTAAERIGRLPWKTLGLSDLRDADGERLWYALSTNFRRSTVNQCDFPGAPQCLNSETPGTLTIRDSTGAIIHDGTTPANDPAVVPTGAIAVVFAPGAILTRIGASTPQDRSCHGDSNLAACQSSGICTTATTARCVASNYLDTVDSSVIGALSVPEDNANFTDASSGDGFIAGPIRNSAGDVVLNDTLIVVRYVDVMPKLEQRIAREALSCLHNYANRNSGHYPWAAPVLSNYTSALADQEGQYFGRLPQKLQASKDSGLSGEWNSGSASDRCPIDMSVPKFAWWANWADQVFFAVAPGYAPDSVTPACGVCLSLNTPSATSRRVIVLVAGRPIVGESRGIGSSQVAYLEDANRDGFLTYLYKQASPNSTFNDTVAYE